MTTTLDSPRRRTSALLYRKPRLRLGILLSAPMLWLGLAYLGALAALFVTAFWSTDVFTGQVVTEWSLNNFATLFSDAVYRTITLRTVGIAALVTVVTAIIAFPMAFYMAKFASPRARRLLVIAVMTPLWASYLVKAYAWRTMLSGNGVLHWLLNPFGLDTPGYGVLATVITLSYLWLPYMILPIYAGLERLPNSLVDASGDLGARPFRTFRSVVLPVTFPAVVAGSIFTFSLSLGDYIAVKIVGGTSQMLGNVVYDNIGAANNLPFAATVATVPVVIMLAYLAAVRRTGALDNL
ncbi:putative spermidine/putrescine transport system permease protein [Amycolatopsis lurida]|uniref:Spermidine/putrescine ABC transporter permease n=1 Tax=Amycolatopsis lurida NRRL 2430 TaxID=1460371 RepID=A0A2P2FRS5_AMYLU|nr:ABC transporter permease [Amycolatopsis lurida]KFU79431.1 spermidine/putrescine ABC transporter permease [Amycolatopsis lurida NRRL 2430]SED18941.1 putative spermidine/putrescine transport system permease protein [Amycolatopsis lurida]